MFLRRFCGNAKRRLRRLHLRHSSANDTLGNLIDYYATVPLEGTLLYQPEVSLAVDTTNVLGLEIYETAPELFGETGSMFQYSRALLRLRDLDLSLYFFETPDSAGLSNEWTLYESIWDNYSACGLMGSLTDDPQTPATSNLEFQAPLEISQSTQIYTSQTPSVTDLSTIYYDEENDVTHADIRIFKSSKDIRLVQRPRFNTRSHLPIGLDLLILEAKAASGLYNSSKPLLDLR